MQTFRQTFLPLLWLKHLTFPFYSYKFIDITHYGIGNHLSSRTNDISDKTREFNHPLLTTWLTLIIFGLKARSVKTLAARNFNSASQVSCINYTRFAADRMCRFHNFNHYLCTEAAIKCAFTITRQLTSEQTGRKTGLTMKRYYHFRLCRLEIRNPLASWQQLLQLYDVHILMI